jgi:hypothetical protein
MMEFHLNQTVVQQESMLASLPSRDTTSLEEITKEKFVLFQHQLTEQTLQLQ